MEDIQPNLGNFQCFSFKKLHWQKLIQVFVKVPGPWRPNLLPLAASCGRPHAKLPTAARKCSQTDQSNISYTPNNTKTKATLNHREISKDGWSSYTTEQQDFNLPPSIITSPPPLLLSDLWLSIVHPLSHAPPLPWTQSPNPSPFGPRPLGTGVHSLRFPVLCVCMCVCLLLTPSNSGSFLSLCQARWDAQPETKMPHFP